MDIIRWSAPKSDYILCSQKWRSSIQSAKTRLGADCGSDHELLTAKFRCKLKVAKQDMAKANINILAINELKWRKWANLIQITIMSTTMGKNPLEEMV